MFSFENIGVFCGLHGLPLTRKFLFLQVGEFLPPNLFVRESVNLPQGCRLAKMSAKPHGKDGERNRKGVQLSPA